MRQAEGKGSDPAGANPVARLKRPLVMIGMMGSGKTAVGRMLASKLDVPFLDSDAAIEEAAKLTIAEIFQRDGEAFFRDRESEVIARLLSGAPAVLSTGGGAYMQERNRRLISDRAVSVWLDASIETLWDRVRHKDTRPLLRTKDPRATLAAIFEARVPVYAQAEIAVRTESGFSVEDTALRVIDALKSRPDVIESLPA